MIEVFRLIRIRTSTQEEMDHQLDNSLADGIHRFGLDESKNTITVVTLDNTAISVKALDEAKPTEAYHGCITKKQLEKMFPKSLAYHNITF